MNSCTKTRKRITEKTVDVIVVKQNLDSARDNSSDWRNRQIHNVRDPEGSISGSAPGSTSDLRTSHSFHPIFSVRNDCESSFQDCASV